MALHFAAYVVLLVTTLTWPQALLFVAIHKGVQGLYLGCSFAPNHKGMPMLDADQAADPLLRQVLTSRNIRGGPVIDTALGGLNYQIEHHLFPSMPRANLRHAQPVVRQFCAEPRDQLPGDLGHRLVQRCSGSPARRRLRSATGLTAYPDERWRWVHPTDPPMPAGRTHGSAPTHDQLGSQGDGPLSECAVARATGVQGSTEQVTRGRYCSARSCHKKGRGDRTR